MPKRGRPEIMITEELCKKAESLAAQGLTMQQLADALGIGMSTIYDKQEDYPELLESIKTGRAKGIAIITNALFEKAKNGDNVAMIFYLKNRAGWADKVENENRTTININENSAFAEILAELDEIANSRASKDDRDLH
jgi:transcriptional regulator with XRE-family HTH domain